MRASALRKVDSETRVVAKPVLKWAGGKTQLLPIITKHCPHGFGSAIRKYVEPFFGGGAVFFDFYNSGALDEAIIIDANPELVVLYRTIQKQPDAVIDELATLQQKYLALQEIERQVFFYEVRNNFNQRRKDTPANSDPLRAAQIIFLNRTCFNGLFRVNSKQHFNVPHGRYKNPRILDKVNILAVSEALQIAEILYDDFAITGQVANKNHFIYYDPPYRPLSKTSSFTAYSGSFDDSHQMRLAELFRALDAKGISQMLSNSDPLSASGDDFLDKLYAGFAINRVAAKRMINSDAAKRGEIFELLVTNYSNQ